MPQEQCSGAPNEAPRRPSEAVPGKRFSGSGAIRSREHEREGNSGAAPLVASLVPVLAGLVASAMLAVDYLRPLPVFCSEGGGCEALQAHGVRDAAGRPLPLLGLVGFLALGVAVVAPGPPRARGAGRPGDVARPGRRCCSSSTQVRARALLPVLLRGRRERHRRARRGLVAAPRRGRRARACGLSPTPARGSLVIAALLPITARLAAARARARGHPRRDGANPARRGHGRRLRRLRVPLLPDDERRARADPRGPHGPAAARAPPGAAAHAPARAWTPRARRAAARSWARGDAMADALFSAPVEELTREGCEKLAQRMGLPLDAYRACVGDPTTDAAHRGRPGDVQGRRRLRAAHDLGRRQRAHRSAAEGSPREGHRRRPGPCGQLSRPGGPHGASCPALFLAKPFARARVRFYDSWPVQPARGRETQ